MFSIATSSTSGIGECVDAYLIGTNVQQTIEDGQYWVEHATYSPDEVSVRFSHRLVAIHPFPKGIEALQAADEREAIPTRVPTRQQDWRELSCDGPNFSHVRAHESDYKNGNPSFPEVDRLMAKLLGYPDSDYYGSVDDFPKMVPLRRWVKASQHDLVHIFPGGNGLRHGVERFPSDYALVLMHDFDVLDLYLDAVENGYKNQQQATSIAICRVLEEGGVDTRRCFFSNRFMGVRDAKDQYGPNPGRRYAPFVRLSDAILDATIDAVRPRVVFLLGKHVLDSLGLEGLWRNEYVANTSVAGRKIIAASLTHTSKRHLNIGRVQFDGKTGHEAEIEIIRKAMRMGGLA